MFIPFRLKAVLHSHVYLLNSGLALLSKQLLTEVGEHLFC